MRFDAWFEKWEALRDELEAFREKKKHLPFEAPAEWEEREDAHQQIAKRAYRISSHLAVTIYYQRPIGLRAAVFQPSIQRSHQDDSWIDTNPMLHHFSVEELSHLADVLDTSDRWEAGLIDEMPPSGAWKLPKPSCQL